MKVEVQKIYTIALTESEVKLLTGGLGATSPRSRIEAGMSPEQSGYVGGFYNILADAYEDNKEVV